MADNTVSNKFTGDSSSAQKAIAELEKKVEDLNKSFTEGKSKAKSAAIAAKEAAKAAEDASKQAAAAAKADAAESRKVLRQWVAYNKQADADAAASRKVYHSEIRRLEQEELQQKRKSANEVKRIVRDINREKKRLAEEEGANEQRSQAWLNGLIGAAGVLGAYQSIGATITGVIDLQRQLIADSDKYGDVLDKNSRKFQVQAGLTALEGKKSQESINYIAIKNAVTVEAATGVATQLVSGGFTAKEAAGEAANVVLQTAAATGQIDGNHEATAKSMTQATTAFGLSRDTKSLKRIGRMMAASYKAGDFQAEDMAQLAPKVQGLVAMGVAPEDILAMYNIERAVTGADVASTGLKSFGEAHAGARRLPGEKKSKKEDLLAMLKITDSATGQKRRLKSEDVDFIGEDFDVVSKRMTEGVQGLKPEERAAWLQRFYGKEHASTVQGLLGRAEQFKPLRDAQFDEKQFDIDVKKAQSGRFAGRVRTDQQLMLEQSRMATDETLLYDQFEMEQRKRGASWIGSKASRFIANTGRMVGMQPESALPMGEFLVGRSEKEQGFQATFQAALRNTTQVLGGEIPTGISSQSQEYLESMKKNNELLGKQLDLMVEANQIAKEKNGRAAPEPVKRPVAVNAGE